MDVQLIKITDLVESDNPRRHPPQQIERLKASLGEWGWTFPVLVDERNRILAGHGRVQAAGGLGHEAVPCIVAEGWSEEQKKAYVIADNRLSETSLWDMEALKEVVQDLVNAEAALDAVDLDIPFLQQLLRDALRDEEVAVRQTVTDADIERAEEKLMEYGWRTSAVETRSINCPECGAVVSIIRSNA